MPWREALAPSPMARVALVAPDSRARAVLAAVADLGVVEPTERRGAVPDGPATRAVQRVGSVLADVSPALVSDREDPDVERLVREEEWSLLAGEAEVERVAASAHRTERCVVLAGWVQRADLAELRRRLEPLGGAVVELAAPRDQDPPTAHRPDAAGRSLRPLVATYGTVPYRDLDPTVFAAVAYMLMFGMMFGDVGHGLALVVAGALAATGAVSATERLRGVSTYLVGAGAAAVVFGFLYGEAFGPTGLVPTLWLRPLDEPETVLLAGLVVGAGLLAATFALAVVNRWREAGPAGALYATSGIAGAALFAGAAAVVAGVVAGWAWVWQAGVVVAAAGAVLVVAGLYVGTGEGVAGLPQVIVEMFDTVLRLGSNVVSFTRLAAFGLTHAVITGVVWDGTVGIWDAGGPIAPIAAVALFILGNLAAFALGALVAAIQALRLEYYELFSRLFVGEGRPFASWHVPIRTEEP